jgi:hypothetical protein
MIKKFDEFLNEEGTAFATMGNTGGMGAVSAPPVSSDGSINTYTGDGSPTETTGRGSGDLPAYDMGKHFGTKPFKKKKKKKKKKPTKESRLVSTESQKEDMYVTSWTDWLKENK